MLGLFNGFIGRSETELKKQALQIQCELLRAGLVPGVAKCVWVPVRLANWNGRCFNFDCKGISILEHRISHTEERLDTLLNSWPHVRIS